MDGLLIVDKPKGISSHDTVDFIRKKFRIGKVGHAGTLDPQATGILVILIGKFTRKFQQFSEHDKEYEVCLTLGISTDSQDSDGQIIEKKDIDYLDVKQIEQVFTQFLGKNEQIPPMFSALKYKGKRLYKLAQQGIDVERKRRQVYIYKLRVTKVSLPHIYFTVSSSKGTYIRTLCQDIAKKLGYPGYMSQLRRIRSGPFIIKEAINLDRLEHSSLQQLRKVLR